jgi:hypothetical protein
MKRRVLRIWMLVGVEGSDVGEKGGKRRSLIFGDPRVAYRVEPCHENDTGRFEDRLVHCQVVSWEAYFEGMMVGNRLGSAGGQSVNEECFIVKLFDFELWIEAR